MTNVHAAENANCPLRVRSWRPPWVHRPHRALGLAPPEPRHPPPTTASPSATAIRRRDRLGGLIHEYSIAA